MPLVDVLVFDPVRGDPEYRTIESGDANGVVEDRRRVVRKRTLLVGLVGLALAAGIGAYGAFALEAPVAGVAGSFGTVTMTATALVSLHQNGYLPVVPRVVAEGIPRSEAVERFDLDR